MSSKKKIIADLLFVAQLFLLLLVSGSSFLRIIKTTAGQSLSAFIFMEAFQFLQFLLAIGAYRAQSSRVVKQTLFAYLFNLTFLGSNIVAFFINGNYCWGSNDNWASTCVLISITVVFLLVTIYKLSFKDPMIKSLLAIAFKSLPQFIMVFKVIQEGGAGIPFLAVVSGNTLILLRLWQIWFAIRESGADKNRRWLFISEVFNEASWAAVSIAWLCWFFSQ